MQWTTPRPQKTLPSPLPFLQNVSFSVANKNTSQAHGYVHFFPFQKHENRVLDIARSNW